MSDYDPALDKVIAEYVHEDGLTIQMRQYDNLEPKIKIGPRVVNGKPTRIGRLTQQEAEWTSQILSTCTG